MPTDLRPLTLLLSVGLMTGCAVGPDHRSPEIDVSSRFLGQEGVVHRDVQSKADLTAWWAGFDDPLLTRFISLALEQNLDMQRHMSPNHAPRCAWPMQRCFRRPM